MRIGKKIHTQKKRAFSSAGRAGNAPGAGPSQQSEVTVLPAARFVGPNALYDGAKQLAVPSWIRFPGGFHAFNCWLPHLYNAMLVFFTK